MQDDSGGLEVQNLTGQSGGDEEVWLNVPPIADSLILNIGDALEYASGGLLRVSNYMTTAFIKRHFFTTLTGRLGVGNYTLSFNPLWFSEDCF
jgi:hypothetical protein